MRSLGLHKTLADSEIITLTPIPLHNRELDIYMYTLYSLLTVMVDGHDYPFTEASMDFIKKFCFSQKHVDSKLQNYGSDKEQSLKNLQTLYER